MPGQRPNRRTRPSLFPNRQPMQNTSARRPGRMLSGGDGINNDRRPSPRQAGSERKPRLTRAQRQSLVSERLTVPQDIPEVDVLSRLTSHDARTIGLAIKNGNGVAKIGNVDVTAKKVNQAIRFISKEKLPRLPADGSEYRKYRALPAFFESISDHFN